MAIDTTPSTVATNALQAIPFASLIGGPLDACIQAQAAAAKTSYEFINQVGLTIDPITGEKKAINVTFQYNNNGQLATLVVPLIILLPIPYLSINTVDIDFLANISAASSSTSETSSDTELGVDVSAEAALKVGPFSLKINAKANYSSKQHSKATADSRYSVEYTMGVKVTGGQADMPAGLAAVLNILQSSITSVGPNDLMKMFPANVDFDQVQNSTLQVTVRTPQGLVAPGVSVSLTVDPGEGVNPFEKISVVAGHLENAIRANIESGSRSTVVERAYRRYYLGAVGARHLDAYHNQKLLASTRPARGLAPRVAGGAVDTTSGVTDKNGVVTFKLFLADSIFYGADDLSGRLTISADIPSAAPGNKTTLLQETEDIAYSIIPLGRTGAELVADVTSVAFSSTKTSADIEILAQLGDGTPVTDTPVTVDVVVDATKALTFAKIKINGTDTAENPGTLKATGTTDATTGKVKFTFTLSGTYVAGGAGVITFGLDRADDLNIKFTT